MILQEQGYEIIVTRKKGCRRLILRAVPMERAFHMTVPWHATVGEIKAFAASNQAWLREHAEVLSQWEPRLEKGEQHRLLGQWVTLGENGVPAGNAFVKMRLERFRLAMEDLRPGLEEKLGVHAEELRDREMKSRWGSCQPVRRVITLSKRLSMTPLSCVAYVLAHELCHLRHPDHSSAFYAELTRVMPDWRERRSLLNSLDLRPRRPQDS